MRNKTLGFGLLAAGLGIGLFLALIFTPLPSDVRLAAAQGGQHGVGQAPPLDCFQCHGSHPDTSQVPPATGIPCFDCHTVTLP